MSRRRRDRSCHELAGAVGRFARALVVRAADGDVNALDALRLMREHISAAEIAAAQALHYDDRYGLTWGDIGRELGISRQGARQRFQRQHEVVAERPESA